MHVVKTKGSKLFCELLLYSGICEFVIYAYLIEARNALHDIGRVRVLEVGLGPGHVQTLFRLNQRIDLQHKWRSC